MTGETPLPITADDVKAAADAIKGAVARTPSHKSSTLSEILGIDLYLKFEIFQFTASFKERGALNKLLSLTDDERGAGVIAMSAGNHAQGVAYHATRLGIPSTIVMPRGTPFTKVRGTERLGAKVVLAGETLSEAQDEAYRLAKENGLCFIHPYDDPLVMAGQGTVGLEFLEDFPDLDTLVIPIGGGGLISGIAVAAKSIKPDIRIIGVQSQAFPSMKAVLEGREPEASTQTIAEGIAVKNPGMETRKVVAKLVDDILVVNEPQIEAAIDSLMEIEKVVVEGAGAAGLAAVTQHPDRFHGQKVGLVLCGGNIDTRLLASCLLRGLVRDGRISRLHIAMPDLPGALAKVTDVVARAGGNVIEVQHQRQFAMVSAKYTELELVVETMDRHHTSQLMASLVEAGFEVSNTSKVDGMPGF